ncbi:MAG TPA: hypothetical protein VGN53_09060 [Klebsiella sp.]|jgi:hypothetical protein
MSVINLNGNFLLFIAWFFALSICELLLWGMSSGNTIITLIFVMVGMVHIFQKKKMQKNRRLDVELKEGIIISLNMKFSIVLIILMAVAAHVKFFSDVSMIIQSVRY